jgi:8-oxo-dGTP pyrophosphatase MutT (NUDIX family)
MAGSAGADLILGTKNIYGTRTHGELAERIIIWNNCGQIVIPGGKQDDNETLIEAAQREFYEETGVDFRVPDVRVQMMCLDDPSEHTFSADGTQFSCTYQMVSTDSPIVETILGNIISNQVSDDELHDVGLVPGGYACQLLGPPNQPLDGWRLEQYRALSESQRGIADRKMQNPSNWFDMAIKYLVGE